jgi:uncharacterized protein YyaL (SSP411 family)
MTADKGLEDRAHRLGRALYGAVKRFPAGHTQLLSALSYAVGPSREVVLVGDVASTEVQKMLKALRSRFIPDKVVLVRHTGGRQEGPPIEELAPFLSSYGLRGGKARAYVCSNNACAPPTSEPRRMMELLGEAPNAGPET